MSEGKYKIVIFDLDDTLLESRVAKWAQHTYVAKKFYNIDLTEKDLLKHWGKPFDLLISELYQNSDTLENMHKAIFTTRYDFPKKIYKESVETVNKILSSGIKVGALSATTNKFLREDLTNFGFPVKEFYVTQGADETLSHKPDGEVFSPILKKLRVEGISNKDIVYVGDSIDDFLAATRAGIDFIAVTTGLYSKKDFRDIGAKNVIKEIQEVVDYLIK